MRALMDKQLLSGGIFSIPEAAKLLNIPKQKLRWWVANPQFTPVITTTIPRIDQRIALSFVNLIEAHFINVFSKWGLHLNSIRVMAKEAKEFLNHAHPFATEFIFKTDGKKIFVNTFAKIQDPKLYDLKTRNWVMPPIVERAFKEDVMYGPNGLAELWYPRKDDAPNVMVNPKVAFGKPALDEYGVPTATLADAVCASNLEMVAKWYEVPKNMVRQAVKFEKELITLH